MSAQRTYTRTDGTVLDLTNSGDLRALDCVIAERAGLLWFEGNEDRVVPRYTTNTDAALQLIGDDTQLTLWHNFTPEFTTALVSWWVNAEEFEGKKRVDVGANADTPALAICLAWLTMHEPDDAEAEAGGGVAREQHNESVHRLQS